MSAPNIDSCGIIATESTDQDDECPYLDEQSALLRLIGKAHTNELLRELALKPEPQRFNELRERLELSPDTLSTRLSELTEVGLVTRRSYDEIPPRVEYDATVKARELGPMYDFLSEWVERHDW